MSTTISYQSIESRLQELHETTSAQELGYDLLRIFSGMSETRINRIKSGKDNLSKNLHTIIVKKLLAYSYCTTANLVDALENLKQDVKVLKAVRLLAVSDGETVLGYDPVEEESYENTLDRLSYDYHFFMPLAGVERYHAPEERDADVKAAYKMARIFDEIRRYNEIDYNDAQAIKSLNVFMSRLLFCFFAEDTGIFPNNIFTGTLNDFTLSDGSDLSVMISEVFDVMSTNDAAIRASKPAHISRFPYVNGGLFAEHYDVPTLSWKARKLLLECGELNWEKINPDIFGSMIQAVISPELRSSLGSHYTSVSNIMKLIQPLFLDELYAEFADARANEKRLRQLLSRMSKIKFLDPACGSGNFLIITYKELRKLEIQIWEQIESLNHGMKEIPFSNISLTQFHGIELDEFAHETATLSLWLAEHQMNKAFEDRFQTHVDALPLRRSGNIVHGNACRIDWNTVCPHTSEEEVYVMGNPPYLGGKLQNKDQKADMITLFSNLKSFKNLDYISCWFFKGSLYIKDTKSKCAFVSTNSICQGEQVGMIWNTIFELDILILFAYKSFRWGNNAKYNAGVTCVIIGLSNDDKTAKKRIYDNDSFKIVNNITPYLTEGNNIIVSPRTDVLSNDLNKMELGNYPLDGGFLKLDPNEKDLLLQNYPKAVKFIRPLVGGDEYLNGITKYCIWIYDKDLDEALQIPEIKMRIEKVRKFRTTGGDVARTLIARSHQFRYMKEAKEMMIVAPCTSSERREYLPCDVFDSTYIAIHSLQCLYDQNIWGLGVISSKLHMLWTKAVGGYLGTSIRYSVQLVYNTFPFPKITEAKKAEIEQAAEAVLIAREMHTEKTLAQMYDPAKMPANLREAHNRLDLVVESCYRLVPFHSDEERLELLFSLYEKMTKK